MTRTENPKRKGEERTGPLIAKRPLWGRPFDLWIGVRFVLYAGLSYAQMFFIRWGALRGGFGENGFVENMEVATLGAVAVVLLASGMLLPAFRGLSFLLGTLTLIACVRELDEVFDRLIPMGGWQVIALAVLAPGLALVWRNRRGLGGQIAAFCSHRAFALMWAGAMITVVYAQLIGQTGFLKQILGEHYIRTGKRLVEESAEIFGYFLLLIGSLELLFFARSASRARRE